MQGQINFINFELDLSSGMIFFHCVSKIMFSFESERLQVNKKITKKLRIYFSKKWFLELCYIMYHIDYLMCCILYLLEELNYIFYIAKNLILRRRRKRVYINIVY